LAHEFAFVAILATQNNVLTNALAGTLVAVVALSLDADYHLIMIVNDSARAALVSVSSAPAREADAIDDNENPAIIAGFGRFGQQRTSFAHVISHCPDHDPG